MKLNKILDTVLNHIQSDSLYIDALCIDDEDELYFYVCDYDTYFLSLLDEGIEEGLAGVNVDYILSQIDDKLKFQLVLNYVDDYTDSNDLNKSIVYFYIQHMFMLSLTDSVLKEAFKDIVLNSKYIEKSILESQKIDILSILKRNNFKLPTEDNPNKNVEFNKGYLLAFMHNNLSYEEQFNVLNKVQNYSDIEWSLLLQRIYEENLIRVNKWFVF